MKPRYPLIALIAVMALLTWAFSPPGGTRAVYAPRTGALPGVVHTLGRALIDVNTADRALLMELPGVGPVLAERIVDVRDELGGFDSVDALLNVPGIGEAKLAAIHPRATACPQ